MRERLAGKVGTAKAQVAQVRAELDNAQWNLDQTTVFAPANGYAINVQLRAGSFMAAFPMTPAMSFVEETYQVIALYEQNELRLVEPGNEAEFALPTYPGPRSSRPRSTRSSGPRARARSPTARCCRRPASRRSAGRFPVKLTVDARDADLFLAAGAIGEGAIYHRARRVPPHPAQGDPARRHDDRLPGPEAALSMANVDRLLDPPSRGRARRAARRSPRRSRSPAAPWTRRPTRSSWPRPSSPMRRRRRRSRPAACRARCRPAGSRPSTIRGCCRWPKRHCSTTPTCASPRRGSRSPRRRSRRPAARCIPR